MTILLQTARLALPIVFFGYGVVANVLIATGPHPQVDLPDSGLLSGGLTRNLDDLYKTDLPHMDLSVGLIGAARYVLLGESRQGGIVGDDGWLFSAEEARPLPDKAALTAMVATIDDIRAQLAAQGVDLVVVPLPAKIDIYRDHAPTGDFGTGLATLYAAFSTQLAGAAVAVVDARSALLDQADPVFFATDTHWTPQGARLVAAAVAGSGLVATGPMRFDQGPATTKDLTGDLVSFVTTPAMALRVGLPAETITTATQTSIDTPGDTGTDIFGAEATDIILVGTSYSANADWGFADALMQSLGRDVVSVAEQGLGPLAPMQSYLASADYRDAQPAVVIWEIPIRYLTDAALWPAKPAPDAGALAMLQKANPDG